MLHDQFCVRPISASTSVNYTAAHTKCVLINELISNHFDEWLGVRSLVSQDRPVPLEFGVLDRDGRFEVLTADGRRETRQLVPSHEIIQRRQKMSSQDVIVPLVQHFVADQAAREKVLLFRNQRGSAEGCANYLAKEIGLPSATAAIAALPTHDRSATSETLRLALQGGAAFHTSDLSREERAVVENAYRDPNGPVRVRAATMTVAAGINTPASTVIIVEHDFPWENRDYTVSDVRNMAGRAGRLGFRETGRAILLAETPFDRTRLFEQYVLSAPEPVTSSFTGDDLGTWLVRLFAQTGSVPGEDVVNLLTNTFGGYLSARRDPAWPDRTARQAHDQVGRMETQGLLERDSDGLLHLTLLGRACGESSLSLDSALRLVDLIGRVHSGPLTPEQLMALLQILPELDRQYTPLFKRGQGEAQWSREASQLFGTEIGRTLRERAPDIHAYYGRAKRACLLMAWIRGEPAGQIETRFTHNPLKGGGAGDIRGIADLTRFHLRPAAVIAQIAAPDIAPQTEAMDLVLRQLETGLPATILDL